MRAVRLCFLHMLAWLRRDMMLFAACAAPVLAGLFFRFGIPFLETALTGWLRIPAILSPYYRLIDVFFVMLSPAMFCFAAAMVSLEETDEKTAAYLAARLGVPAVAAFLVTLILFPMFQLTAFSPTAVFLFAVCGTLQGMIVALLVLTVSSNKLEGMAVTKLATLSLLGAVVPFFVKGNLQYVAFALPSFWMGRAACGQGLRSMFPAFALSGVWICLLLKRYQSKM